MAGGRASRGASIGGAAVRAAARCAPTTSGGCCCTAPSAPLSMTPSVAGDEALTWLERPVPADVQRVGVTLTAAGPVTADPRTDLGHGMLAGAGFVLEPVSGEPQAAAAPPSAVPEPDAPPPSGRDHVDTAIRTPGRETVFVADEIAHLIAEDGSRVPIDRPYVLRPRPATGPGGPPWGGVAGLHPRPRAHRLARAGLPRHRRWRAHHPRRRIEQRHRRRRAGRRRSGPGSGASRSPCPWAAASGSAAGSTPTSGRGRTRSPDRGRPSPPTSPPTRSRASADPSSDRPRFTAVVAAARNSGCDPSASTPTTTPSFTSRRRYDGTAG